jgi:voltage-gated potassium channel
VIFILLTARAFGHAFLAVWRDPHTKALPVAAGTLVATGTIFYWHFEDWTIIESLYFCVITLATVGYGDLSPTTPGTQIFTIFYVLAGFGVLAALLTSMAHQYMSQKAEGHPARDRLHRRRGQPG